MRKIADYDRVVVVGLRGVPYPQICISMFLLTALVGINSKLLAAVLKGIIIKFTIILMLIWFLRIKIW
jgi:hypothetical protein